MQIRKKILHNVSLTAHPQGCAKYVYDEIEWVRSAIAGHQEKYKPLDVDKAPKRVLILGGSTGYGLATRIVAAFAGKAATLNVSFEREPAEKKTATPGWYDTVVFEREAQKTGLFAQSLNADAFSNATKQSVIKIIKEQLGTVDLVVYSLASPVRTDPRTYEVYRSVLKPIGEPFTALSVDTSTGMIEEATFEPAEPQQIEQTIKVMGGEDWKLWIEALQQGGCLAENARTIAYSYIGPQITYPIYREGTIGKAKEDLERTAKEITTESGIEAYISVNKALVTRASAVIPVVPLYISLLYQVMEEKGVHESCIEQMYRLFATRLCTGKEIPVDPEGRIRMDDWEMSQDVQQEVIRRWGLQKIGEKLIGGDLETFNRDYDHIHGFGYSGIDYDRDVSPLEI